MVHLITYDLKSPRDTSEDYRRVIDGLKIMFGTWCHLEKSVWLVETSSAAPAVRDAMAKYLSPNDVLFVIRVTVDWASRFLSTEQVGWLNARSF